MPLLLISLPFFLLIGIGLKDIYEGRIPDVLLALLLVLSFFQFEGSRLLSAVGLGLLGVILKKGYRLLKQEEGLGWGDVKMMAVSGMWLVPTEIPLFLILTGLGGALTSLMLKRRVFPLGPALAFALGICMVRDITL